MKRRNFLGSCSGILGLPFCVFGKFKKLETTTTCCSVHTTTTGSTPIHRDAPKFQLEDLPLPTTHSDFRFFS